MTGTACTDVQRKWNTGAKRNVGLVKAKHINFRRHRRQDTYPHPSRPEQNNSTPSRRLFSNHEDFKTHINSSIMAPLYQLQNHGIIQLAYRADVEPSTGPNQDSELQIENHTDHSTHLTCRKCSVFYQSYIALSPNQISTLEMDTKTQSRSQVWHDARRLRLTASTVKRVPKRHTTDPQKFLNEHVYPTFTGNTATKYGSDNEVRVITLLESRGHDVHNKGLVVHPDHPWLAASPDGILDGTKLLEIKCPFKSLMSLEEFLTRPNGDIKILDDGKYLVLPNGRAGYYLQVSRVVFNGKKY